MSRFSIGQMGTGALKVDLPTLVDTRALVTASSGSGKSWLFRLIAERTAGKVQVVILDPEGEFATLRERFDMLLVGEGGEAAVDARSARLLARKLAELGISAIVDLYGLDDWDARRDWVALFLEGLMSAPKDAWHPLLVMIDEAHMLAPESAGGKHDDPVARSRRAVNSLMSAGRKRGYCGLLATQRISKLHKDAIAECKNVFIGGTTLDIDQQRAADILGMGKAERVQLRDLVPGEFFAFGPAIAGKGVLRFRTDQVVTTHPKVGQRHALEVPKASDAVQKLAAALADLPAQAQRERDDLTAAKRRVVELERELRARPVQLQPKVEQVVQRVEIPVFKDGEVGRLESAVGQLVQVGNQLGEASDALRAAAGEISGALRAVVNRPAPPMPRPQIVTTRGTPRPAPTRSLPTPAEDDVTLRAGERKMLQALAQRHPLRYTRAQLGTLSGFTPSGGTFNTYFGVLKRAGFIVEQGGEVSITDAGLAYLGADVPPAPSTTAELQAMWRSRLRAGEARMLDVLVANYPNWVTRRQLGELSGFAESGGTFSTYLGVLRRNGLAEVDGEHVRASPTLFID